jgi:hypothetical protein
VAAVRNELGHKDPYPRWVHRYTANTGPSGTEGFVWFESLVTNKHYDLYGHSDFMTAPHMEEHWMPFIRQPPNPLAIKHGRDVETEQEFLRIFADTDQLDIKTFGPKYTTVYVTDDMAISWIKANPDIYTFLVDRRTGNTVGYLNAPPVTKSMYNRLRQGKADDNSITGVDVLPYEGSQDLRVYLMSIVIDEDCRQLGQGPWHQAYVQLIGAFLDKLIDYARHKKVFVSHLLATAWTEEGQRVCRSLGMRPVGRDRLDDVIFEVNLQKITTTKGLLPALSRLLSVYNELRQS